MKDMNVVVSGGCHTLSPKSLCTVEAVAMPCVPCRRTRTAGPVNAAQTGCAPPGPVADLVWRTLNNAWRHLHTAPSHSAGLALAERPGAAVVHRCSQLRHLVFPQPAGPSTNTEVPLETAQQALACPASSSYSAITSSCSHNSTDARHVSTRREAGTHGWLRTINVAGGTGTSCADRCLCCFLACDDCVPPSHPACIVFGTRFLLLGTREVLDAAHTPCRGPTRWALPKAKPGLGVGRLAKPWARATCATNAVTHTRGKEHIARYSPTQSPVHTSKDTPTSFAQPPRRHTRTRTKQCLDHGAIKLGDAALCALRAA